MTGRAEGGMVYKSLKVSVEVENCEELSFMI